jgi:hypothetical protein
LIHVDLWTAKSEVALNQVNSQNINPVAVAIHEFVVADRVATPDNTRIHETISPSRNNPVCPAAMPCPGLDYGQG